MPEKNSINFEGYRLVLFDCKEGKIVIDELIEAFMGGYVKLEDESKEKYASMSLVMTRCQNRHAIACAEAAEAAVREFKKELSMRCRPGLWIRSRKWQRILQEKCSEEMRKNENSQKKSRRSSRAYRD